MRKLLKLASLAGLVADQSALHRRGVGGGMVLRGFCLVADQSALHRRGVGGGVVLGSPAAEHVPDNLPATAAPQLIAAMISQQMYLIQRSDSTTPDRADFSNASQTC